MKRILLHICDNKLKLMVYYFEMSRDNCLYFWCCVLGSDETKPWYKRNNFGKIITVFGLVFDLNIINI